MEPAAGQEQRGATQEVRCYMRSHGLEVYLQDAASLLLANPKLDQTRFMADYLSAVACGQHAIGRHYSYVAATKYNRCIFLSIARQALQQSWAAGGLTLGDYHSLLQLLCPDLPLAVVKNAWSSALAMQAGATQPEEVLSPEQQEALVEQAVFLRCFTITFLLEPFLMSIRQAAFGTDKTCLGVQQLQESLARAPAHVAAQDWPMPPAEVLMQLTARLTRKGSSADFSFGSLVRGLCLSNEVYKQLQQEVQEVATAAAMASMAETAAVKAGRGGSAADSEEDSSGSSDSGEGPCSRHGWAARASSSRPLTGKSHSSSRPGTGSGASTPWR